MIHKLLLYIIIFSLVITHLNINDSDETNFFKKHKNKMIIISIFIFICILIFIDKGNRKFINESYDSILKKIKLKKIAKK